MVFYLFDSSTFITLTSNGGLEASSDTRFTKFDQNHGYYEGAGESRRIRVSYGCEGVALGVASWMSCDVAGMGRGVWRF